MMIISNNVPAQLELNREYTDKLQNDGELKYYEYIGRCPVCGVNVEMNHGDPETDCPKGCTSTIVQIDWSNSMRDALVRKGII